MEEEKKEAKEEKTEDPEKQLEDLKKQRDEYLAGWQRAKADFSNYKKDEVERIGELVKYANAEFILKILPILDNFDLVDKKIPDSLKNDEYVKGILQIRDQFQSFLKNLEIEEVKTVGQKFDPNFHEVVDQVEDKEKEPGTIIEEIQKGYLVNGNLLRPAKVRVAK